VKTVIYGSTEQVDDMAEPKAPLKCQIIVSPKMLSRVWDKSEYQQDICHVTKEDNVEIY
jgi:hypothetical protein